MNVQFAETAAELLLLVRRDVLIAEKYHQVVQQRLMDFFERFIIQ